MSPFPPFPATAAHPSFAMAGTSTTTTTLLPQSISTRQPPMCLNVVDPSDHHPNNLSSYHPRPRSPSLHSRVLISIVPPLAFQRPDRRLTSLIQNLSYPSSNYLNTLLSSPRTPPPLLKYSPPSSRVHSTHSSAGIARL